MRSLEDFLGQNTENLLPPHPTIPNQNHLTIGGGRAVRWCWANFQCRGVLLIWIRIGQGSSLLAGGAGGVCLDIFSLVYLFSFFLPPSLGDGPI